MSEPEQAGFIIRQKMPANLEFPFSTLKEWVVPSDQFYVRSHFRTPAIDVANWRLTVEGAINHPLTLTLADIQAMPATRIAAVLECAGNGRIYYEPVKEGVQWQTGAVGNAYWTGVPLRAVLEQAGLSAAAVEVVLQGADRGQVDAGKKTASPGEIAFARSLPLPKALAADTLLAYAMNDEPLTPAHGYPLRALIPGWYGMASVKWLARIQVIEQPFMGYWQTRDYIRWERSLGEPTVVPLSEMPVKSQIAQPTDGAFLPAGRPVHIYGAAWSGAGLIRLVEVSTDGGQNWTPATLLEPQEANAWNLWEFNWTPAKAGSYTLLARATDTQGNVQPASQQPDRESYMVNWLLPVQVNVR